MQTGKELQNAVKMYETGNKESFTQIYELSYKYLYTCVIHIVKDENVAMDMLQETYIEVSRNIHQLENTGMFLSWAATIATRKCYSYLKKNRDILGREDEDNYFENIADDEKVIPEVYFQDKEKQRLIREIIDELTDIQRFCVISFYYNEQKQTDIAQELGVPVNTVKSHLNRAKSKMKEAIIELDEKKGTRLYSFAPFVALLFNTEAETYSVPAMSTAISSALGLTSAGATEAASIVTITKAAKATGMAFKTKLALGIAGVCAAAIIGVGSYIGITQQDKTPRRVTTSEESRENKESKENKENKDNNLSKGNKENKVIDLSYFQSWDTTSRNLAGENRYLYAGGNKITMPTTIGEWEELLRIEFVDVYTDHFNYVVPTILLYDKNGITYQFDIDMTSYISIPNDVEPDLAQLRCIPIKGIEISCRDNGESGVNKQLSSFISLVDGVNMFKDDIEVVNKALAAEYGITLEEKRVEVDRWEYGYTFVWSWGTDGSDRKLEIEYVSEHILAYYQYLNNQRKVNGSELLFSEEYDISEIKYAFADVTNDGVEELLISKDEGYLVSEYAILAYDKYTGKLRWLTKATSDSICSNGLMADVRSYNSDGTGNNGYNKYAKNVICDMYVYNLNGEKLPVVSMAKYSDNSSFYINDKEVSEETYETYWDKYWCSDGVHFYLEPDVIEDFKYYERWFTGIRVEKFRDSLVNGEGIKVYTPTTTKNIVGDVEEWKENYIALIQAYISGNASLYGTYEMISFDVSKTMEEQMLFGIQDINNDGIPELFLKHPYEPMHMFLPKGSWDESYLGTIDRINPTGSEIIKYVDYSLDSEVVVYDYNGDSLSSKVRIFNGAGEAFNGSDYVFIEWYAVDYGNGETEISYEEYERLVNQYTQGEQQEIALQKLSIDNLKEALNIEIYQLDGLGYEIGPKEDENPVVTAPEEQEVLEVAQSAEQAYEEFLAGKREAVVDARYSNGKGAPYLFLAEEKISLTEMCRRIYVGKGGAASSRLENIQYAYIDCGGDRELELAVRFYDEETAEESICVLKYRNNQLYITYNTLNVNFESESVLYQNGVMKWNANGGLGYFYNQWEILDRNGVRHVISQEDECFDVFTVDELTDDWIYYDEIESINVYTINGLSYYDVQCAEGYDYDKALEIAKGLLSDNIVQLKSTEIIALKEQLMERYNASTEECEIITWTDLVPES